MVKCCNMDSRTFFLLFSRILFGAWLFYAGFVKIYFVGAENFVGYISGEFSKTWSPAALNTALAWIILIAELLLGILLMIGIRQRCVWTLTTLLMFLLTFGQTMLQKESVGDNWIYTIFALACAALSPVESAACCSEKKDCGQ